jgi:hypothetical protein
MPAKDYKLCVSPLTGAIFISKISKKNPNVMLDDRVEVDENWFYFQLEQFLKAKLDKGATELEITKGGKVVMEIKLFR